MERSPEPNKSLQSHPALPATLSPPASHLGYIRDHRHPCTQGSHSTKGDHGDHGRGEVDETGGNKQGVRATQLQPHFLTPGRGCFHHPRGRAPPGGDPQDVNPRRPAPFRAGRGLRAAATGAREVARTGPGRGCREVAGPPAPPPPSLTHGGPGSDLPRARRPGRSAPGPPPSRLAQLSARRAGVPASSPAPASPARASQVSAAARGEGGAGHAGQGRAWRGRKAGRGLPLLPFHAAGRPVRARCRQSARGASPAGPPRSRRLGLGPHPSRPRPGGVPGPRTQQQV